MGKGKVSRLRAWYICSICCLLGAGITYGQQTYNRYHIEVTFDPKTHTLQGVSTVEYYNSSDQPLNSIYFLLLLNQFKQKNPFVDEIRNDREYWNGFDPSWTKIESVSTAEGNQLPYNLERGPLFYPFHSYSLDETVLRVDLPQPLVPGSSVTVKIAFTSKAAHLSNLIYSLRSGYKLGIYSWLWFWYPQAIPAQELTNGRSLTSDYFPSSLHAAWHEVLLTIPKAFHVAAASDYQEVIREEGAWKTVRIYSDVPTRSAGFVLSQDFQTYRLKGDIPIEVYYHAGNERAARLMASYASEILDYYRQHFGRYIYRRLVIVENPDWGYNNSAGDALVFMGRSHFDERDLLVPGALNRFSEFSLAHEIAHMWWFFGVGLDANAETWISEGFVDYMALSYFEEKYGEFEDNLYEPQPQQLLGGLAGGILKFNLRRLRTELNYLQNIIKNRFDEALVKPIQNVEYLNALVFKTYMKSVLMLRALRGLLGREQMEAAIRTAYERHMHQIMTTEDFRAIIEEVSGRDLKDFFQQWFYQDTPAPFVDYAVAGFQSRRRADSRFETEIQLLRQGSGRMPVEVVAITEDGQKILHTWTGEEVTYTLTIESTSPIRHVQLDPHELTPDVNRFDNFYPRKWRVRWGGYSLSLDTYQIAISPLGVSGGFRLDHRWSFTLIPGRIWFFADFGRETSVEGQLRANFFPAQLQDHRLFELPSHVDGELSLKWRRYEHPHIGSPGKVWEATDRWRFSLLGRLALNSDPSLIYIGLDYRRQETLRRRYALWVSLRQGLNLPFSRLTAGALLTLRLAPNIYLDLETEVGLGWKIPQLLQFELQLNSLPRGSPYRGDFKLHNKATVSFPLLRDVGYSLANLALLRQIDGRLWLIVGDTASTLERLGKWKAEVGVGINVKLSTLGGLLTFNTVVGITYPIAGVAPDQRQFTPYFELELPGLP